jgi:hypothetical protein
LSKRAERTSKQKRQCAIVAITLGWRGECWLDGCCGFDCGGLVRAGGGTLRCYDALIPHHTPDYEDSSKTCDSSRRDT